MFEDENWHSREVERLRNLGNQIANLPKKTTLSIIIEEDEHPEDEHPEDEHPEDEHPEDEHPEDEHPEDEHPEDEHPEDDNPEDADMEDEYPPTPPPSRANHPSAPIKQRIVRPDTDKVSLKRNLSNEFSDEDPFTPTKKFRNLTVDAPVKKRVLKIRSIGEPLPIHFGDEETTLGSYQVIDVETPRSISHAGPTAPVKDRSLRVINSGDPIPMRLLDEEMTPRHPAYCAVPNAPVKRLQTDRKDFGSPIPMNTDDEVDAP
jgi:hypothetical protein